MNNPTFILKGRIDHIQLHEGRYFHVVTTPAPDAYSKPSRYKLASKNQLGQEGQEITVQVTVSGSVYEKQYTDRNTGIKKTFHEPNVYMEAVPATPQQVQQTVSKASQRSRTMQRRSHMPARSGGNMTKVQHGRNDFRRYFYISLGGLAVFRLDSRVLKRRATVTSADVAIYVGALFSAYATGWGCGFVIYAFKRSSDFL